MGASRRSPQKPCPAAMRTFCFMKLAMLPQKGAKSTKDEFSINLHSSSFWLTAPFVANYYIGGWGLDSESVRGSHPDSGSETAKDSDSASCSESLSTGSLLLFPLPSSSPKS